MPPSPEQMALPAESAPLARATLASWDKAPKLISETKMGISRRSGLAAAGPIMNLLLAIISVNAYLLSLKWGWTDFSDTGPGLFFIYLAQINLLLMIFNLLPVGALDGHYILSYLLPRTLSRAYRYYNARYGNFALLALVALAIAGVPIFSTIIRLSEKLLPAIAFA